MPWCWALGMSVGLFFLLPMVIGGLFDRWITSNLGINLLEGVIRMGIFFLYMYLISRMKDMRRLFSYHGAEHKTIRCYEAKLPLTVENVRRQTRLHPQMRHQLPAGGDGAVHFDFFHCVICPPGSGAGVGGPAGELPVPACDDCVQAAAPASGGVCRLTRSTAGWAGMTTLLTRIVTAPGMWFQNFTTNEPDDSMIEVAIAAAGSSSLPETGGR